MARSPINDVVIPDSELTRHVSPLPTTPPSPTTQDTDLTVGAKPKVRVTYGRKPIDPSPLLTPELAALPPSSAPVSPPRSLQDASPTYLDSAIHDDGAADNDVVEGDAAVSEEETTAEGQGFAYDWQRQLAQLDDSDEDEAPANDENVPPPLPTKAGARIPLGPLFSGSTPPLTSSSQPHNQSSSPRRVRRLAQRIPSSRSTSPVNLAVPVPDHDSHDNKSSPLSEDPSKLFESPPFLGSDREVSQGSPDSSPTRHGAYSAKGSVPRASESPLFLPDDDDRSPAVPTRERSSSTSPPPDTSISKKARLSKLAMERRDQSRALSTTESGDEPEEEGDQDSIDPVETDGRRHSRKRGQVEEHEDDTSRKKTKKLSKKQLEEMQKETSALLARQDASIPRHENRRVLSNLLSRFQISSTSTNAQTSQAVAPSNVPGLKKLPRPSITHAAQPWTTLHQSDDPIVDGSSPFMSSVRQGTSAEVSSSEAGSKPGVYVASNAALPARTEPPAKVFSLGPDSDDELPDEDALLEADRQRREREKQKAEDERRRKIKLEIIERRNQKQMVPASRLLHGKDDSDSELEVEENRGPLKGVPAKKGGMFLDKLMSTLPRGQARTARPTLVPTDSQLSRAARPSFDNSSPPSARKKGREKNLVTRESLNLKLLTRASEVAEREVKKKEEDWMNRGGKRRERVGPENDMSEVLRQALENQDVEMDGSDDDDNEDQEWKPDGLPADEEQASVAGSDRSDQEDSAAEMDEDVPDLRGSASPPRRSSSLSGDDKENDVGANKENEAPPSRKRAVLGEMPIEPAEEGGTSDSETEPWRPRKRRRLVTGAMLVLDAEDDVDERVDSTPVARKLFQDITEDVDEDDAPKELVGLGAPFGLAPPDASGGREESLFGVGGLSQFFVESQPAAPPLSALRIAASERLQALSPTKLMPSIKLSTQQRSFEDEIFAEDQEARMRDAFTRINEQVDRETTNRSLTHTLPESFPIDDFTQRDNSDPSIEFLFDMTDNERNEDISMDKEPPESAGSDLDGSSILQSEAFATASSPRDEPFSRLRRVVDENPVHDDENASETDEPAHSPSSVPNAFDALRKGAVLKKLRERQKEVHSVFVEGEAEEEEDEPMLGFGTGRHEEEESDEEENAVLAELVDDAAMDEETKGADLVREKAWEHLAEDDAALEKYHQDVVDGKKRMRRRGDDFGFDDSDDEDEQRAYQPVLPQIRKNGAESLTALGENPETVAYFRAYQATFMPWQDDEFTHLEPPPAGEADEDDEEEESDEEAAPKVVSAAQLREELRHAAQHKETIAPHMNVADVSWLDRSTSDDESDSHYVKAEARRRARPAVVEEVAEDMMLGSRARAVDPKQKQKMAAWAKEESRNNTTNRGGGAVTGYAQPKALSKQPTSSKGKGKQVAAAPRKSSSFFDRKGGASH